jgi:hypothetical protein
MGLVERQTILRQLTPPLDAVLAEQLLDEFISLERRYVLRDWEPAELDGGQFAEILARILCQQDSGAMTRSKKFDECLMFVEDGKGANTHSMTPRQNALHLARVLRTIYNFRSQRGAVHISPSYTANHMDAKFMVEGVRWAMNETLRIFLQTDREAVARIITELLQFDVPCVGRFENALLVQRTDLSAEEEILVLLHYGGDAGFSRKELGRHAQISPTSVTLSLQKLTAPDSRQVTVLSDGNYRLTDLGAKRIREHLAQKLLLG